MSEPLSNSAPTENNILNMMKIIREQPQGNSALFETLTGEKPGSMGEGCGCHHSTEDDTHHNNLPARKTGGNDREI